VRVEQIKAKLLWSLVRGDHKTTTIALPAQTPADPFTLDMEKPGTDIANE